MTRYPSFVQAIATPGKLVQCGSKKDEEEEEEEGHRPGRTCAPLATSVRVF